ncbi:MAG: NTP transferase domain-containing protein [Anaerolineae bacterium]|nr:NTP transferase domain-containing protein [Anaerolineae bacterium]
MKLVIPMAGFGTRMRPHTWTRPKPLLPLAGKPMLAHILERFRDLPIEEYVFITGWLGDQVETYVRETYTIPSQFVEQKALLGQAHALWLAREYMTGPLFVLFVDTLIDAVDFSGLDAASLDGVIFTKEVEDPRRFGVVETDAEGRATHLVEKPDSLENKNVLVGLYYFQDGAWLARACETLMERRIQTKGEYYLADAVTLMIKEGANFTVRTVNVWEDTGKPETTLMTHRYILEHGYDNSLESLRPAVSVIPPVNVHPTAVVERSVIGPYVSIHAGAQVRDSVLRDVVVDEGAELAGVVLENSLIGRWVKLRGQFQQVNVGDSSMVDSDLD